MAFFQQILQLPYIYIWLPGLVFFLVVGAVFWLIRPRPAVAAVVAETPVAQPAVVAEKPKDQRYATRRQGNPVQVFVAFTQDKSERQQGSVLDRSVGGMRLAMYQPVEIGTRVSIRPTHADDIVPWVELEIRSCRPSVEMLDQYELGCQYVKSPPYSIQLLFG